MTSRKVLKKIKELEKQLADLKIELTKSEVQKTSRLDIGDEVCILNPGKGQERHRKISKVNYRTGRATVTTVKEKVSRAFKNLERR